MSDNTGDIVNKIVQANALENSGEVDQAIALYQEILELDWGGNYGNVAQQALEHLQKATIIEEVVQEKSSSWWDKLSIKAKTTVILTSFTLVSSIGIGILGYTLADTTVTKKINTLELAESYTLTKEIAFFMRERYGDIQVMAGLSLFSETDLRASSSIQQKQKVLDNYVAAYGLYDSIAAFDLNGNPIAQSTGKPLGNHKDRSYFQEVLKTNQPFLSQPIISKSSGISSVYLVAPIKDNKGGQTVGIMRARMPVEKLQGLLKIKGDALKTYLLDDQGNIFSSSDEAEYQQILASTEKAIPLEKRFDFHPELKQSWNKRHDNKNKPTVSKGRQPKIISYKRIFQGKNEVAYYNALADIDAKFLQGMTDLGWSTVVSIDNDFAFATQRQLRLVFIFGTIGVGVVSIALARLIATRATRAIIEASEALGEIGQGNFDTRIAVKGEDELATLGSNINKLTGQIADLIFAQESEAKRQRDEKNKLQQGVMTLLLDVEGAQKGDLTVKATMTDGAVGSIADAFNSTIGKLRNLLQQVQSVSSEVGQLSQVGETSVQQLSQSALSQADEINVTLGKIDEINQSVETVANYAQEAAQIARKGSIQAKEGDLAMDETVKSIETIRNTVANTSKKVKQLAESSQEIAQIVEIISGISEKTNLLAFNASVEAARAGEHGEGFRIVAEEVRRLADRITESTKDIQQLVTTIQQDTSSVLQGMETSTSEVVNGSELVRMTKSNLRSLAETSQKIDEYLNNISTNTIEQTNTSQEVNLKINDIATLAKTNSTEAQNVVESLRTLVSESEILQVSLSQFIL